MSTVDYERLEEGKKEKDVESALPEGELPASDEVVATEKVKIVGHENARKYLVYVVAGTCAFLSAAPNFFTMPDLSGDAWDKLLTGEESPSFLDAWGKIIHGNAALGAAVSISSILAFMAMAPFNAFNTFRSVKSIFEAAKSGKEITWREKTVLQHAFTIINVALSLGLISGAGGPIGMFTKDAMVEMTIQSGTWQALGFGVATIFAGIPITSAVKFFVVNEAKRTAHAARDLKRRYQATFFISSASIDSEAASAGLLTLADDQGRSDALTPSEMRERLSFILYKVLNAAELLRGRELADVELSGRDEEVLAKLIKKHVPWYKVLITDFVGPFLASLMVYEGTTQFFDFGKLAAGYVWDLFGGAGDPPEDFAKLFGVMSQSAFFMLWTLLIKPSVLRPIMRLFPSNPIAEGAKSATLAQTINCALAYVFGSALGFTNVPLIAGNTSEFLWWVKVACAITANAAVSASGFKSFIEQLGVTDPGVNDEVSGRVSEIMGRLHAMSDEDIRALHNRVETKFREAGVDIEGVIAGRDTGQLPTISFVPGDLVPEASI